MYQYDQYDHAIVKTRVDEFRDQVNRRLSGELSEEEFRPQRLMNGLYLQLHAYMLRVAVPYGTLSSTQMRKLAYIARTYDKDYGHFTTRQNIQYNWPKLVETPDILQELADVEMHAIQTSGNCIRNVTTDQFAGATAEEVEDPRPWAELIRQWSTFHPEFSFLPRKFKIAITAAEKDRAAIKWHDIGLILKKDENDELGFEIVVGGGMGRTPVVGKSIRDFLPKDKLLSYLEAIMRVYNAYGRRDNKYKARIKILVEETGVEQFTKEVEEEWARAKTEAIDFPAEEEARIRAFFAPPPLVVGDDAQDVIEARAAKDQKFAQFVANNLHDHKVPGHAIVTISLKPHGGIPGDATSAQMDLVADLADKYSQSEIRITHEQNLVLPHVARKNLPALFDELAAAGLATPNAGLLTDIIACPGLDYCSLANARSIPIAQEITQRFDDIQRLQDIGELKIKISGCINSCGHHHAGHIGILGVDRKGEELYQLMLGGSGAEDASKAEMLGRGFPGDQIVDALETVVGVYLDAREDDNETFLTAYSSSWSQSFQGGALWNGLVYQVLYHWPCITWPMDTPVTKGSVIVPFARFEAENKALLAAGGPVGVTLNADTDFDSLPETLGKAALIEIEFGAFGDGRGFTLARRLRRDLGFEGELRAKGPLVPDQALFLLRTGFDTIELETGERTEAFKASLSRFPLFYQAAQDHSVSVLRLRHTANRERIAS